MNVTEWAHVQALFEQALAYEPDVRTAFLRNACGDDPALYDEVAALLDADARAHPLLDGLALDALDVTEAELLGRRGPPMTVGAWRLGERVGLGGMGEVFRAERAEGGFAQTAALKLVRRGMDSQTVVLRFAAERQILARLQHPGIARLIDGGMADDGRPFFAMEFVEGEPLTDYCDAQRLPVEDRLRLFAAVCEAVRYAHRNLVVHRDLKPSNILVAEDEGGAPHVKLLDFGIARLLAADDDALLTQTGQRVLTPAYAAPEQITGGPITTATDVYALGGLLYRLLCGHSPIETEGRTAQEVERAVHDAEPRPPTARITPEAAEARGTTPERLTRLLRGDLDTIALAALRKEPERRYGSAAELLDDVARYLDGQPIAARRDARGYRLRKFVSRHRAAVAAPTFTVALVAALIGFYTARLAAERDRAQGEADKTAEVSAFLVSILDGADPLDTPGETLSALDLLERGAARIERDLADEPDVRASMLHLMGQIYDNLGQYEEAERLLRAALDTRRRLHPQPHPDVAETERVLGTVLRQRGARTEAERLLRSALATQQRLLPPDDPTLAHTMRHLASLLRDLGEYAQAEALYRDALAAALRTLDETDPLVTDIKNSLGVLLENTGRFEEATNLMREVVASDRAPGDLNPDLSGSLTTLSTLLREQGDAEGAEAAIREALRINRAVYGEDHPEVATSLRNLASILRDRGALNEAGRLYERALAIRHATYGRDHPRVANLLNSYGGLLMEQGEPEAALALYREAARIHRTQTPPRPRPPQPGHGARGPRAGA